MLPVPGSPRRLLTFSLGTPLQKPPGFFHVGPDRSQTQPFLMPLYTESDPIAELAAYPFLDAKHGEQVSHHHSSLLSRDGHQAARPYPPYGPGPPTPWPFFMSLFTKVPRR